MKAPNAYGNDEELRKTIGQKLREARLQLGLTQVDVAERAGISSEVYGRLERGGMGPSVYLLKRLALVLNASPGVLLGVETTMAPSPPSPAEEGRTRKSRLLRQLERRVSSLSLRGIAALLRVAANMRPERQPNPSKGE